MSGIPFAIVYGFLLIWIVSTIILGQRSTHLPFYELPSKELSKNICASILDELTRNQTQHQDHHDKLHRVPVRRKPIQIYPGVNIPFAMSSSPKDGNAGGNKNSSYPQQQPDSPGQPHSAKYFSELSQLPLGLNATAYNATTENNANRSDHSSFLFDNDPIELYYATGAAMGVVGLTSIFSRNTRATMLLLLPGLITRHSRHLIFTIVWGILSNGPALNLRVNFNKLLENAACMYKSGLVMSCIKQVQI